jgi:ATP-dependent Clp protease ATP-binding subunit ClpC
MSESKSINQQIEELYKEKKTDEARPLIQKFLADEPDNLDAHAWMTTLRKYNESLEHYIFIFDRDINYKPPWKQNDENDFAYSFCYFLSSQSFILNESKDEEEKERNKRIASGTFVKFAEKFLTNSKGIPSVHGFAEALLEIDRYDDVISLAKYITGEVKAADLGWPGLTFSGERFGDPKGEILDLALRAFFFSNRHLEACRWIFDRMEEDNYKKKDYEYFLWYMFGYALCWMGYPEECARAWIIAIRKGFQRLGDDEVFDALCKYVIDFDYREKSDLYLSLYHVRDLMTPDKKEIYEEIKSMVWASITHAYEDVPDISYIEKRLGVTLSRKSHRYSFDLITIPSERSADPVVKEMIAYIDKYLNESKAQQKTPEPDKVKKEKVTVGGIATVRAGNTLEQFGVDLTGQALSGNMAPIIGRDKEIARIIRILSRAEKNNPVLLGEAGVGKTAVVQGLAQRIVRGDVPEALRGKKIIELNVGVLVAGTTYRGDFEQRMTNIIKETSENPSIILFIDELHTLMGAGAPSHRELDGSNILKPALAAGNLRLIGATTSGEYSRSIEKDAAMERRFSPVWLSEIDGTMTRAVLDARKSLWEKHHGVRIDEDVFDTAIKLTDQFIRYRHFPDKAIDVVDEACALARTLVTGDEVAGVVKLDHIEQVIESWCGSHKEQIKSGGSLVGQLQERLGERVTGHEKVINRLAEIIVDEKLGLHLSRLPRVFCFAGHSQSGKTETAGAIAQALWPGESDRFLFVNMALNTEEHDLWRITGAPKGYVGSDVSGVLPLHIAQRPHSVVYLYQFTKAHHAIKNFFGNLFTEGCFTDPDGRTVYAGSTIFVISTTCEDKGSSIGFGPGVSSKSAERIPDIREHLRRQDTPLNVIDSINEYFWFEPLTEQQIRQIVEKRIKNAVNQPGVREMNIGIDGFNLDSLIREVKNASSSLRNFRSLLNRKAFGEIVKKIQK